MNRDKGKLIIFSAPSGAGKTTIVKRLLETDLELQFSVSACNRSPRNGEVHGREYYFISTEEFKKKIEKDEFVEWEEVFKNKFYGTLKSEVERVRNTGRHVLFDIDVKGGLNLKEKYGEQALSIFVMPPSLDELAKRLINRQTETEKSLQERIKTARLELKFADRFDKILENDELEQATRRAYHMIRDFVCK